MEYILEIIDLLGITISQFFYWSLTIGQFIVKLSTLILENLRVLFIGCTSLLVVIFESFNVFVNDLIQGCQLVLYLVLQLWEHISENVIKVTSTLNNIWNITSHSVVMFYRINGQTIVLLWNAVTQSFVISKQLIILFGSGVWFAITLVPYTILELVSACMNFAKQIRTELNRLAQKLLDDICGSFKNLYEFLTDVPIESLISIMVAVSLVYIFTQFYVTIFSYFHQQIYRFVWKIYRKFRRIRLRIQFSPSPVAEPVPVSQRPPLRKRQFSDQSFCVICQERLKCVLLLPCRHACLCNECNRRLELYINACPICRSEIEETMQIFV